MEEFLIEDSIEKRPNIFGLRAVYFFIMAGALLLAIFLVISLKSFIATFVSMIFLGVMWLFFWYKTNDFVQNKYSDAKLPDIINCNPE
ncbi:MAG: hypothetical protein RLO12_15585 [Fulvivirga sp.]